MKQTTKPGKKEGTSYQQMDVAFKNLSFKGKVEGKMIMSFGAQAETFKTLATAQPGTVFDIEVVKNAAGYNDWVSAKKATASSADAPSAKQSSSFQATAIPKSTYETPEERAKKQIYIVRQSSLSSAIDLLSVGSKSAPNVDDVLKVAKIFEGFVFGDSDEKVDIGLPEDIQDSEIE